MRKVFVLVCIFFVFLFGLTIGGNFNKGTSQLFEESKNQFESEITNPNNNYDNIMLVPDGNLINKTAKKVEKVIDNVIDKLFSFLA